MTQDELRRKEERTVKKKFKKHFNDDRFPLFKQYIENLKAIF